ncbi:MAG: hypothetical protein JKX70_04720 [Phycisphaerales bacterium]|nr:hypothetical protein [Phycisphaerales bacterium]
MSNKTRTRRDHMKYLNLISTIASIHQHQREIKSINNNGETIPYIEVEISDIQWANKLAHIVLGRTLDELPPQTRTLLTLVKKMIESACDKEKIDQADYRFSRRGIREYTHWSDSQLKTHCGRLTDMEYLIVHKGGRGQSIVYELAYDGQSTENSSHMMGLIDVKQLYDFQKSGSKAIKSGIKSEKSTPSLAQVCPKSGGGLGKENTQKANNTNTSDESNNKTPKNARPIHKKNSNASHRNAISGAA